MEKVTLTRAASVEGDRRILALGDSHCTFWNGRNSVLEKTSVLAGVDVERIGPIMAYSLPSRRSEGAAAKIDTLLSGSGGRYGLIIVCFGEIDVRAHVLAFAIQRQAPIAEIVDDVAESYLRFVDSLVAKHGIPVALWGPPPSRALDGLGYIPALPVTGAPLERNVATALLTKALAARCANRASVEFFSIFDQLVGFDMRTLPGALYDSNHMSNANMPAALTALRRVLARLDLRHLESCLERASPLADVSHVAKIQIIEWTAGREGDQVWLKADSLSAFVVDCALIPEAPDVQGLGPLLSVTFGEGRAMELVSAANAERTVRSAGDEVEDGDKKAVLVARPTKPRAIRHVTFTFRSNNTSSMQQDDLVRQGALEKLEPTLRLLVQALGNTADLRPLYAHLNAQALLDDLLRFARNSVEVHASVFAPDGAIDRRFFT